MSALNQIINSLFSPNSQSSTASETYIAHVPTFEQQPNSAERKPRFLILSAMRDSSLKLHKAKQNANGTFSIGKTWPLQDLRTVAVIKPLEFSLVINGKPYKYETAPPTAVQATFLVTVVRCWRKYNVGRNTLDLILTGFSVDNPAPSTSLLNNSTRENRSAQSLRPTSDHSATSTTPSNTLTTSNSRTNTFPRPSTAASSHSYNSQQQSETQGRPSLTLNRADSPTGSTNSIRPRQVPTTSNLGNSSNGSNANANSTTSALGSSTYARNASAASINTVANSRDNANPRDNPIPSLERHPSTISAAPTKVTLLSPLAPIPSIAQASLAFPTAVADPLVPHSTEIDSPTPLSPTTAVATTPSDPNPLFPPYEPEAGSTMIDEDTVLANVEEMLEGFEWRSRAESGMSNGSGSVSAGAMGMGSGGKGDEIEKRLVGELKALEAAAIHAIIESDDRVNFVIQHLDDALAELERMDLTIGMYSTQLNLMNDDIAHIESQNRGLQVQTSNQRVLLAELDTLMETIHIPEIDLTALSQESLENPKGIERLERAAVSLYKAILSTRDSAMGEMSAASERVEEYRVKASQFCKRLFDFLAIMFKFQVDQLMNGPSSVVKLSKPSFTLPDHAVMEDFLGRYCGLMLFVKEIDQARYQGICAAYFTSMSDLHKTEVQALLGSLRIQVRKPTEDDFEANFSTGGNSPTVRQGSIRRAGTVIRSPLESGRKDKDQVGKIAGHDAFATALLQITPHILREQGFISDLLHINPLDASITFADYMMLDTYFRRGAMKYLTSQQGKLKEIRQAMDLVFGWLEGELRDWIEAVLVKDNMQIIGILSTLDQFIEKAEEAKNEFLHRLLQKQYQKTLIALERACKDQIKSIEQTKLTLKKRKGVVPFVRVFPLFVLRVEAQLTGSDGLKIRETINSNYDRISSTMFEALQQMAKMSGEGASAEDKDQLNYYVIIIENMHHLVSSFSKDQVPALASFVDQAREKYQENLNLYIKLVLRRPLARLLDFFQGLETLLRTTPPTEVSLHTSYTKPALRRTTSSLSSKDLRKAIEVLFKRVDKHFAGDSPSSGIAAAVGVGSGGASAGTAEEVEVLRSVWRACEEEVGRLVEGWKGLIGRCYPDEKGLEFSREEVSTYFSKAQTS